MLLTLLRHNPVPICSTLMRRSVMLNLVPLPDTDSADIVMMARAATAGVAFYYVPEPLMLYRLHAGQLSGHHGFMDQVASVWDEFDFPPDSELERTRREQPMWSREDISPVNLDEWLAGDVGHLHRAYDLTTVPISSRPGGPVASLLERALRRLLLPVFETQTSLNGANARVATSLARRVAAQGQAIESLEQQVGELERERRT
jgi:hypothetical protein